MQDSCASLHMDGVGEHSVKNACLYPWPVQLHSQLHHLLRLGILQVYNLPRVGLIRMDVIWRYGCEFNLKRVVFEALLINMQVKISGKQKYI